jgi:hypothetical protein
VTKGIRLNVSADRQNSGRLRVPVLSLAGYITGQSILLDGGAYPGPLS